MRIFDSFSIPLNINTNISHKLFYFKITLVNSQLKKNNSKDDFVSKKLHALFLFLNIIMFQIYLNGLFMVKLRNGILTFELKNVNLKKKLYAII